MECLRGGVVYLYPLAAAVVVEDGIVVVVGVVVGGGVSEPNKGCDTRFRERN